jgi:hypothetical protein
MIFDMAAQAYRRYCKIVIGAVSLLPIALRDGEKVADRPDEGPPIAPIPGLPLSCN